MAKIEKADREQLLYVIAEEFGGDGKAWEQLAIEMVKAMSDTQAKEILGYIAKNWDIDTMGYEASTKKSKVKKMNNPYFSKWENLFNDLSYKCSKMCTLENECLEAPIRIPPQVWDDTDSLESGFMSKNIGEVIETIDRIYDGLYNARYGETDGYGASAKKSKMNKSNKLVKIPLVDVNKDDIEISFNFASTGNESLYDGRMVFYTYASFMKGYDKDRFSGGGIRDIQVGRFEYPIAEALNPVIIEQMKEAGYQAVMNEIDDFIVDDDLISDYNPSGIVANPGARFGNINGYDASAKKSKSFNEMIKEQRKQYKNKKVL